MTRGVCRALLAASAAIYAALAVWVYVSQPAPAVSTLAQIQAPLRWAPNQPQVLEQLGRHRLFDRTNVDPALAEAAFIQAARANPMESTVWTGLADTYLQMGNMQKAESALRTALEVFPRGPAIPWRLANSLVLAGRPQEAIPLLSVVAHSDPGQQQAVYDLSW